MGFLDYIKELFTNNKKNTAKIITKELIKNYGEKDQLEVALYDGSTPLSGKKIMFLINGVQYARTTDVDGIARMDINLPPGEYTPLISFNDDEYNLVTAFADILIKEPVKDTRMEGTDINMTYKDGTKYQCAVYDENGRVSGKVNITVNGVTYNRTADAEMLYKLAINLNPGTYKVTAEYLGDSTHKASNITNTIIVKEAAPKPEQAPEPAKLYPYITKMGGGKLGQTNGSRCGPHSLMQVIYRLTGIELSESTLASVCGTTSNGTSHQGLETGLAWFNRKYGYNLKMTWKNFSDLGDTQAARFKKLQEYNDTGAVFCHILYRNQWGHYEVPQNTINDTLKILNSLGEYCGYPAYCGYIESRSRSTQQTYINGISQKSICIITRGD